MTDDEFEAMIVRMESRLDRGFRELTFTMAFLIVTYFVGIIALITLW